MKIRNINIHWWKIIDTQLVHSSGINSVYFLADALLVVNTSFHIIKQYLFSVSLQNCQVVTYKLDICDQPFKGLWRKYYRLYYLFMSLSLIYKHFIRKLLIHNSYEMNISSLILIKSMSCKIIYFFVHFLDVRVILTVNINGIRHCCTFYKMSNIHWVLSIYP